MLMDVDMNQVQPICFPEFPISTSKNDIFEDPQHSIVQHLGMLTYLDAHPIQHMGSNYLGSSRYNLGSILIQIAYLRSISLSKMGFQAARLF